MLLPQVNAVSSLFGIVASSAVRRALPTIRLQDQVPSDLLNPAQAPTIIAGLAASAQTINLILESTASSGIIALLNCTPLSCSHSRNCFNHLDRISADIQSSQDWVDFMVSLSKTLELIRSGASLPRMSNMLAFLLATNLLVNFLGTKSSSCFNISEGEIPELAKISTFLPSSPLFFLPKCSSGILTAIVSSVGHQSIPPTPRLTPSLETFSEGTSPVTVQSLASRFTIAKVSSACWIKS